jgi:uncharacterized protein YceK
MLMFTMKNLILVALVITLGGCASFTESVIAVPGTVVDAVGGVASATWNLLTGWIPGVGPEVVDVPVPEVVEETVVAE